MAEYSCHRNVTVAQIIGVSKRETTDVIPTHYINSVNVLKEERHIYSNTVIETNIFNVKSLTIFMCVLY